MIELADRLEIHELYARYNQAIDDDRFDDWVDLFTPDGVFVSTQTHAGHAALAQFVRDRAKRATDLPFRDAQHWNDNIVLTRVGDEVCGMCYLVRFAVDRDSGEKKIVTLGRYQDEIRRHGGVWLFARRSAITV